MGKSNPGAPSAPPTPEPLEDRGLAARTAARDRSNVDAGVKRYGPCFPGVYRRHRKQASPHYAFQLAWEECGEARGDRERFARRNHGEFKRTRELARRRMAELPRDSFLYAIHNDADRHAAAMLKLSRAATTCAAPRRATTSSGRPAAGRSRRTATSRDDGDDGLAGPIPAVRTDWVLTAAALAAEDAR